MSTGDPLQRHEIPTHLEVEDRILFGLTLRQGIILLLGATAGYFLFAQSGQAIADIHVPLALRIGLGLLPALVALAVAMIQPAGRPLEDWFFAIVRYLGVPKQCVWRPRPSPVTPLSGRTADESVTDEYVRKVASANSSRVQFP
jgi:PrgI family protein